MNIMEIIMNNIFNRLGKPFKNVQVLGLGEALYLQRVSSKLQLALEFNRRYAVQFQCFVKQSQQTVNLIKGGFGN